MTHRRTIALILIVLGGILIFFAPREAPWAGPVLLVAGLLVEGAGVWLERRAEKNQSGRSSGGGSNNG
ncbi:MAG: hypothetical protein WBX11_15935 [Thiobacillaceae bacterium]